MKKNLLKENGMVKSELLEEQIFNSNNLDS
jgi:hypothetical protein